LCETYPLQQRAAAIHFACTSTSLSDQQNGRQPLATNPVLNVNKKNNSAFEILDSCFLKLTLWFAIILQIGMEENYK